MWKFILAFLSAIGYGISKHAGDDIKTDGLGMNQTDKDFVAYLKRMVANGSMSESEALSRFQSKGGTREMWDSVTGNENSFLGINTGDFGTTDDYSGFLGLGSSFGDFLNAYTNRLTGAHMTGAEVEANQMSMQNQEDIFGRQVAGMQKAGLNPALMYQNGASPSTPQAQSSVSGAANMSDLMSLLTLPLQMKMLKAQTANVDSQTRRNDAETELAKRKEENMALVNAYYPAVTEAGLQKTLSSIGVDISTIDKNEAQTALTNVQKLIADKENKYADEYYHWRSEYEKAHTQEAKDAAAAHAAQALMTGYEYTYASEHGAKLSSSSILALCSAIGEFTGLSNESTQSAVRNVLATALDDTKHPGQMYQKAGKQVGDLAKKGVSKLKSAYKRFDRWRNNEKKMPWVR